LSKPPRPKQAEGKFHLKPGETSMKTLTAAVALAFFALSGSAFAAEPAKAAMPPPPTRPRLPPRPPAPPRPLLPPPMDKKPAAKKEKKGGC
jgi:hypothetical protein